jgi:hypothetical protein
VPLSVSPLLRWTAFALAASLNLARAQSVRLELGSDMAGIMAAQPPGTSYVIAAGVHRAVALAPKDGDTLTGEPGAVLNGCLQLTEWIQDGEWWVHPAPVILPDWNVGGDFCSYAICRQPQDLYADDRLLEAVEAPEMVINESTWFLDKENARILVRFDPREREMEFGGPSMTAINCLPPDRPVALGVVIENLKIEKYPNRPQSGSVQLAGGAVIRNCEVSYAHGYGIGLGGHARVIDCYIHHNGMTGIGGSGSGSVIEGCEISHNVWKYYAGRAWDNGGVKLANARDVVFRRNYVHHNAGPGIWTDIKTSDVLMEDNIVELNDWEGLLPELSSHVLLRRNICRWNGVLPRPALWGAQVCIQNSSFITVENNYLETGPGRGSRWGNPQGVMAFNQNVRKLDEGNFEGNFTVREIIVRNNLLVMPGGGQNGIDYGTLGWHSYQDFLNSNLVWQNNRYLLGRPLFHLWSWRLEETWENPLSSWLRWESWSALQDAGSTLDTFGPETYLPTSTRQHALIKEVTGHDYPALKQALTRKPPPPPDDQDTDGLLDAWEHQYFGRATAADPLADDDTDGLSNAQELAARTSPVAADTDEDGVPDGWELAKAMDPLIADGDVDQDGDGLSAREEYEDETILTGETTATSGFPQNAISMWLTPSSGLTLGADDEITSWKETGPDRFAAAWIKAPRLNGLSPSGAKLINTIGTVVYLPGRNHLWGRQATGFTLCFVFQPSDLDVSRLWKGLLSAEEYLQSGFRLRLESGYLVWSTGQSGGTLAAEGRTRLLPDQTYIVTLVYGGAGRTSALYVNGSPEMINVPGTVVPTPAQMMLAGIGGVDSQNGRFGDVALFDRRLNHRERREVEGFLRQKFITGLPEGEDRDRDGLPDAWELIHSLDPLTPNARSDEDADGLTNDGEWKAGLNPLAADTDQDSLPDGWEVTWKTNPLVEDASEDPDGDNLSNHEEFLNGTDPRAADIDPLALPFQQVRLWWRTNQGLTTTGTGSLGTWNDSSPTGNSAQPHTQDSPIQLAEETLAGWKTVRIGANALVSTNPVDTLIAGQNLGATVTMVLRPPAGNAGTSFQPLLTWGDILVGVHAGKIVARNATGSLSATSANPVPTEPFILNLQAAVPEASVTLRINGTIVASLDGLGAAADRRVELGGADAWPADVAEVVVHAGLLSPLDRRFVERVLQGKWLRSGPLMNDSDADGLATWWEQEAGTDPAVADADGDSDWDGISNFATYQSGSPGFIWEDLDRDGMHDGWERSHQLDPAVDDGELDPDLDGLPNAIEHALLLPPRTFTPSEAWLSMTPSSAETPRFELLIRNSIRSWAAHPFWETTSGGENAPWIRAAPSTVVGRTAGSVLLEKTELMLDPSTNTRLFLRVRLDTR